MKWVILLTVMLFPIYAHAEEEKCKGPKDICEELLRLRKQVADKNKLVEEKEEKVQKTEVAVKETSEYAEKTSSYARDKEIEADTLRQEKKKEEDTTAQNILIAGMIATGLRILYSVMKAWKGFFTTERQKAGFKIAALFIGVLAFVFTNLGLGMSWMNSLILAGGGPGAIMIHEFTKLLPIMMGRKKFSDFDEEEKPKVDESNGGDSNFPGGLF